MFGVDEGAGAAQLLHFGNHMQRERRLARAFRAVDFHHATARQTAHAERHVQAKAPRADDFDILTAGIFAHAHDRALAEFLFDVGKCSRERLFAFIGVVDTNHAGVVLGFLLFSHFVRFLTRSDQ